MKIVDEIPEDFRKELNIPENLGIMEINNKQVRKYDASKKRKTPTKENKEIPGSPPQRPASYKKKKKKDIFLTKKSYKKKKKEIPTKKGWKALFLIFYVCS